MGKGKVWLAAVVLAVNTLSAVQAQDPVSDLTVTLPTGKVVHFQTLEQKEKFEAAQAARAQQIRTQAAAAQPTAEPFTLGHTALDEKPTANGKVNPTAPTFTADYYMFAPESWAGKQVTLSVAFVHPLEDAQPRPDGLVQMESLTYNDMTGALGGQSSGGYLTVLAKPEVASRLVQQCGTKYQYNGGRIKTTIIKGELRHFDGIGYYFGNKKQYGFLVEK